MAASLLIIASSSALLVYWFRYTCALILTQKHSANYALKVASTIRLHFPHTEEALQTQPGPPALDRLYECLQHDYRILADLLFEAASDNSLERRLLTIDFKLMRLWYGLTRTSRNLPQARSALSEMSSILRYFAAEIAHDGAF